MPRKPKPSKTPVMTKSNNSVSLRRKIVQNEKAESSPVVMDVSQKVYKLKREKASLQAKVKQLKKELAVLRSSHTDSQFAALNNLPQVEKFPELADNVKAWTKYTGFDFEKVSYTNEDSKSWFLKCSVDDVLFEIGITCGKDETTNKGCVQKYQLRILDACKDEIQSFFDANEGNIEQIFKILKVYVQSSKAREEGLKQCEEDFGDLIHLTRNESGERVIELGTANAFYFQIKWKLVPSRKHFASIKNVCRISCTKEGDEYIKSSTDFPSVKKQLNSSPMEVIRMLCSGITATA